MKFKNLIPLIPAAAVMVSMLFSNSCANTTGSPSGGPKDTIPPVLVGVNPLPGQLNVPTHKTEIVFTFNEYVQCKDPKAITVSPPLEKPVKSKLRGKSIVLSSESDLEPNTTYTIDITGAVVDNNEGNPFAGYALTFSTGERIDSMYVTGIVQDCNTLNPVKGATVMLYKDHADSALFLHRPDACVKTDAWGFFCLRNIQDTVFRLYAIDDKNGNNIFDPATESVAFADSTVRPVNKVADGIYELYKFDMLDTAACLKRKNEYELAMFTGLNSKQDIKNKGRIGERTAFVSFMSRNAQVDSVWFKGINPKRVIRQFNETGDSLLIWIRNTKKQADTLHLNISYMKTDTTGELVKTHEVFKLARDAKQLAAAKSSKRNLKHEDTIAVYKAEGPGDTFEQYGIKISFEYPLIKGNFDSLKYEVINARQKKSTGKYTWQTDTNDLRTVYVKHSGKVLPGFEYILTVPHRMFRDINGYYNDSTVVKVKLPDDDKLSLLRLNVTGVGNVRYIVDLLNEKRDKVIRNYVIKTDSVLDFPYLKEGKYSIRITEDKNGNGRVDTGDLLMHIQPEKVKFYRLKGNDTVIDIPPSSELTQDVNLKVLFEK